MATRTDATLKSAYGTAPEQACDARARAWVFVFDRYAKKAAQTRGGEDAMKGPKRMIAPQQHSIQDGSPDDLLAKLRKRLDHRWQELTEESAIDPAVALERGYYLEKTKRGLEQLGFKRS